ncbi:flavin reductase (DIM6/NTAB) family NADH-FMN oxidoreductase RutF [Cryobacterium sp. MP_M5]|uniref:flavin reductase family protein n=1 Tax=unclassified Cryobacterium TaxID=2649013 RepID=UPI0018C95F39|nr:MULTISPECIES: flavin reductase family protein [unclassified Cryobacterium]MBG6058336.1 flavin reductase (DIM6/NTAB) family NADH-FMN oxidoreductase RutF [Cryobacterium sp. MP_M3]MEC5177743.1 flavin reductase (DIM6/NTAB) family NADH-FMN oxidoreductase RutF [Cryobacterium sp. MP_M5]
MNDTEAPETSPATTPATAAPPLEGDPNAPQDLAAFKHAFRRHAAGVAVITSLSEDGTPVGFTATSLASLASVPPLATFNMARSASTWPAIAANDRVVIHILGARNRALAQKLSGPQEERFVGDHWAPGPHGLPVLTGVTSWMVGRIVDRVLVHNSAVVIVQIEEGGMGENDDALLYHERAYRVPGAEV